LICLPETQREAADRIIWQDKVQVDLFAISLHVRDGIAPNSMFEIVEPDERSEWKVRSHPYFFTCYDNPQAVVRASESGDERLV
jgi:hypothetical protein